jgi:hypothetical protein
MKCRNLLVGKEETTAGKARMDDLKSNWVEGQPQIPSEGTEAGIAQGDHIRVALGDHRTVDEGKEAPNLGQKRGQPEMRFDHRGRAQTRCSRRRYPWVAIASSEVEYFLLCVPFYLTHLNHCQ